MNPLIEIQIGRWIQQKKMPAFDGHVYLQTGLKPGYILPFAQPDGFDDFAGRGH